MEKDIGTTTSRNRRASQKPLGWTARRKSLVLQIVRSRRSNVVKDMGMAASALTRSHSSLLEDESTNVEDDDGNVVGAASVAAILCTEVKHNWKLQVEGAEYHRNKDGTKVFRLGSRKPFTGAENAMRYLKHVSLRREVNDLLAHCTNSKTWESSIEDTTKDLLDRRANGGSALCVSICHFSVKATHKGTFAIRDSHDIQLMLVDSNGKCMSREFARVVEVREFFNNQLKWKTKK